MASVVVVCPDLPFPPDSGGNVKSFFLLKHLCAHHDVALVSVTKGPSARHIPSLRAALPIDPIVTAQVDRERTLGNFARSLLSRRTMNEFRTYDASLERSAQPLFRDADCILVDHLEVMQYVPERFWPKTVLHTHNAEHVLWSRKARISRAPQEKIGAALEARRIAAKERRFANGVAAVLAAPGDQQALRDAGATGAHFHRTYHLGDDTKLLRPDVEWGDTDPLVFYMGALSWEPNFDGLEHFIRDAWPHVERTCPDARFVIGGANAPDSLRELVAASTAIELVGFVDEPEDYFSRARVVVAPLRFGSGMKLKVLEAMTRGVPLVTTPIGVESIDADDGRHLLIAERIEEMGPAVVRLLTDAALWESIRDASRDLVRRRYTWDVVRADFDAAMARVVGPSAA